MDETKMKGRKVINFAIAAVFCSIALRQTDATAANVSGGGHGMDEKVLSWIPENLQAIVDRGQSTVWLPGCCNGKITSIGTVVYQGQGTAEERRRYRPPRYQGRSSRRHHDDGDEGIELDRLGGSIFRSSMGRK